MTRNENTKKILRPNLKEELNKTSTFMLPAIDLDGSTTGFKLLSYFGFINCYIDHPESIIKNDSYLYMVFNPDAEAMKTFYKLYGIYKKYSNFVDDYVLDHNLIVVVFRVKDKWKEAYKFFKESKYSLMTSEYGNRFMRINISGVKTEGYQYLVITKNAKYREHLEKELDVKISPEAELMSPIDPQKEIFNYARYKSIEV